MNFEPPDPALRVNYPWNRGTCNAMTSTDSLRGGLLTVEVDGQFTVATMQFRDGSSLCFCHRVGERWAKAFGRDQREDETGLAGALLAAMKMFRLNAKHLDIQFEDGSRWDESLRNLGQPPPPIA